MSTCHACGAHDSELVLPTAERNLQLRRCSACGFVYLESWRESLSSADELYDYYAEISEEDLARRHTVENRARQLELLQGLERHAPGQRLLDVGCGDGQLLKTAGDAGWDAMGVDVSEAAIDLCRKRALNAMCTNFFSDSLDTERFDVIVMSELIEHVPEPRRFMKRATQLLRPGGILYLTTPNFGSLARRVLGESWSVVHPEHIGYFEKATLRAIACDGAGLRELRIDTNNISPSTIVAWLQRGKRRSKTSVAEQHRSMRQGLDQQLRRSIHAQPGLQKLKVAVNRIVSPIGLGDTLVGWFQKP